MKNEMESLLQKEMDRKSFLKHVAIGFVALTGIGAIIKTMNGLGNRQTAGYGSSAYGGTSAKK